MDIFNNDKNSFFQNYIPKETIENMPITFKFGVFADQPSSPVPPPPSSVSTSSSSSIPTSSSSSSSVPTP